MYKLSYILKWTADVYFIIHAVLYEISHTLNRMKYHTPSSVWFIIHAQSTPRPCPGCPSQAPFRSFDIVAFSVHRLVAFTISSIASNRPLVDPSFRGSGAIMPSVIILSSTTPIVKAALYPALHGFLHRRLLRLALSRWLCGWRPFSTFHLVGYHLPGRRIFRQSFYLPRAQYLIPLC